MDAKKHLETAFELISTIPVAGDKVEAMAKVRAELRAAYAALNELEKARKKEETENG